MKFSTISAVILDGDGVLWQSDQGLPGLVDLFAWFKGKDIPYILASNNSTRTPEAYVAKMEHLGVSDVSVNNIVTSATATVAYLQENYPAGTPVHVFGMDGLKQLLDAAGFDISREEQAEIVVAGMHFEVTYPELRDAALAIRRGARFIGTNPDKTFPAPEGIVPGAGSLIAALETATDQEAFIIGKPKLPMFDTALKILGTTAEQTLMVGDRLNTDILGAKNAGMQTALVFTGVTTPEELSSPDNTIWPDVAYDGLPQLLQAWAGHEWYQARIKAQRGS